MKILWLSHRDIKHPRYGGAERTIYEIGKRFVAYGNNIEWVSVKSERIKPIRKNGRD
jgi:hypothetical protein